MVAHGEVTIKNRVKWEVDVVDFAGPWVQSNSSSK